MKLRNHRLQTRDILRIKGLASTDHRLGYLAGRGRVGAGLPKLVRSGVATYQSQSQTGLFILQKPTCSLSIMYTDLKETSYVRLPTSP